MTEQREGLRGGRAALRAEAHGCMLSACWAYAERMLSSCRAHAACMLRVCCVHTGFHASGCGKLRVSRMHLGRETGEEKVHGVEGRWNVCGRGQGKSRMHLGGEGLVKKACVGMCGVSNARQQR